MDPISYKNFDQDPPSHQFFHILAQSMANLSFSDCEDSSTLLSFSRQPLQPQTDSLTQEVEDHSTQTANPIAKYGDISNWYSQIL